MNKKLKYGVTLVILTSIATNQNIHAASLWQRIKDIAQYRWASALGSLGLGYAAYTAEDPKYKILAGLCSAGLLKYACSVSNTSTLEGLVAENTGLFSQYFKDKIREKTPYTTLNNLTNRLHQATTDEDLKKRINQLHAVVQEKFVGKNEKDQRTVLNNFFDDPSNIQQKIDEALAYQEPSKKVTQRQRELSQKDY